MEFALELMGSTRLVVDALAKPLCSSLELRLPLPGEGMGGATLPSLSLDRLIVFGFEKSFIFELLGFGSFSGGGPGACIACGGCRFGEGKGDLPFGKATLAAVAAAKCRPPSEPFEYGKPPADEICGLDVPLGLLLPSPAVLIGVRPGYDRFRSLPCGAGGATCIIAA